MAPVSPRQKSMYLCPSTSTKCEPLASATKMGTPPGQRCIQLIGTPPMRVAFARSKRARDRGWASRNLRSSSARSALTRARFTPAISLASGLREVLVVGRGPAAAPEPADRRERAVQHSAGRGHPGAESTAIDEARAGGGLHPAAFDVR